MNSPWNTQTMAILEELHGENLSASAIATEITKRTGTHFSRNSIIGKLLRMGLRLSKHPLKYQHPPVRRQQSGGNTNKLYAVLRQARRPPWSYSAPIPEPDNATISFYELNRQHCRWPKDGPGLDIRYCGATRISPYPYCAHHCLRAYQTTRKSV